MCKHGTCLFLACVPAIPEAIDRGWLCARTKNVLVRIAVSFGDLLDHGKARGRHRSLPRKDGRLPGVGIPKWKVEMKHGEKIG